jgi:uncharacterized paraquat-inducible protein A
MLTATLLVAALCVMTGCKSKDCCGKCTKPAGATTMAGADVDVCSHCPGVQHATADGKCEKCGMALAK